MNEYCTPLKGDNDILNYDMVAHIVSWANGSLSEDCMLL